MNIFFFSSKNDKNTAVYRLTGMFNGYSNDLAINNGTLQLLWDRKFYELGVFGSAFRHKDVDGGCLCSQNLDIQAILAQVELTTVTLVNDNGGGNIKDLDTK
jgi:hypothetical protein